MRAELVTIGAELTSGATLNTNAAYLSRRLAGLGITCPHQVTVDDDRARLVLALTEAVGRSDVVVTTGGLGPTFDDITMAAIAEATGRPLAYQAVAAATIRRFYTRRHRRLQRAALRQAYLPCGGVALPNPIGTAPGLWLPLPHPLLIALPGVPGEMRAIFEQSVLPHLAKRAGNVHIEHCTLRTVGIVELVIEAMLKRMRIPANVQVGLYPHLRAVDIRLTAIAGSALAATRALDAVQRPLRRALGDAVYGTGEERLEEAVGRLLVAKRKTLALAESCTGGLVSHRLTDVPGSSRYLRGCVVAYHNRLKEQPLGVPRYVLRRFGAVSAPVAQAMALGARRIATADIGLSITGIAGPTGATRTKPVGLVYLGLSHGHTTRTRRYQFFGDRDAIKHQAAQAALDWLRRSLR